MVRNLSFYEIVALGASSQSRPYMLHLKSKWYYLDEYAFQLKHGYRS
jgi:hypothetical protein